MRVDIPIPLTRMRTSTLATYYSNITNYHTFFMAITCIVVDDEEMAIEHLLGYIAKVPFLSLEGSFTDPNRGTYVSGNHPVELVFLDIEMPICH